MLATTGRAGADDRDVVQLVVLDGGAYAQSVLGVAFVAVQVVTVLAFAELEFIGLRRAQPAVAG